MKRLAMAFAALAVLVAACSDGEAADTPTSEAQAASSSMAPAATSTTTAPVDSSTTSAPAPPDPESAFGFTIVTSDDGDMVIQVPDSVTEALTVDILDPVDWPAPLQGAAADGSVKIYDLGPSGATFSEPVRVSRRLDVAAFDELDLGPVDLPLVTLLTTRDDGTYELLDELAIIRRGSEIWVTGTTTHFSPVVASNERSPVTLRWAGEVPIAPAARLSAGDPTLEAKVVNQRLVDIFLPTSTPASVEGLPFHYYGELDLPPITDAEFQAGIEAYEEQDAAAPSQVLDPDYDSPYMNEIVGLFGRPMSDDVAVSLAGFSKKVKPSSLPSAGALLAWTPEGVDPAEQPEAIEIGFGIVLITGRPPADDTPAGGRTVDARVSIATEHTPVGTDPSNQRIEISLAELEQSLDQLWLFNYKNPPSSYDPGNAQSLADLAVASMVEATVEGNRLSGVLGIDCYCEFGYGVLQAPPGAEPPAGGEFGDLFEAGVVSVIGDPATGPVTVGVSDTEGEVFSGPTKIVEITR